MVPLGAVGDVSEINGPLVLTRYNMYPAASINGTATPGISSGQAIDVMAGAGRPKLPKSMSFEWTELAYLELQAGNTAMIVFGFVVVMVFLVLAAQFESWSLPLAVILVGAPVPLERHDRRHRRRSMDINIFTQIGLVVLVGLASKNAILIVEFAKVIRRTGKPIREATLEACRLRLRPIVMTSMAFILGVRPAALRPRRRRRDAADAGDGRLQRHARRDHLRDLAHARVLLPHRHGERVPRVRLAAGAAASAGSCWES